MKIKTMKKVWVVVGPDNHLCYNTICPRRASEAIAKAEEQSSNGETWEELQKLGYKVECVDIKAKKVSF